MNVLLTGNPNSGKTSLFNELTGLNHKVGNYPGVTVDKVEGHFRMKDGSKWRALDIPGTYSLYPKSKDEQVAINALFDPEFAAEGNVVVVVMDAANIKRSLFFATQVLDLGLPTIAALTMEDIAEQKARPVRLQGLSEALGIPVVSVNPRTGKGMDQLKTAIQGLSRAKGLQREIFFDPQADLNTGTDIRDPFLSYRQLHEWHRTPGSGRSPGQLQELLTKEVTERYKAIDLLLKDPEWNILQKSGLEKRKTFTEKADKILMHPFWGILILISVMLVVFQCVFWLASYPMDMIDELFSWLTGSMAERLPEAWWSDLLVNGIITGLGGVVIFIPQIAILFFLITILEDSGYMARISFLMDRLFQSAGLSGKSVMPLISGMACAIPAVMAARTIESPKQRLLTILVTPFMSCSARLPVYAILISLVIPEEYYGIISLQGLVLLGMYLLGFVTALVVSKILSRFIAKKDPGFYLQELPVYQQPRWKNALFSMIDKSKIFVFNAGKVIMIISVALWFLSSFGPPGRIAPIEEKYSQLASAQNGILAEEQEIAQSSELLENSYMGIMGHSIEPVIAPLGYDWKIGIALIASFAAREVFVGTMATIYAMEETEDNLTLRQTMLAAKRKDGTAVYTLATGLSLMIFYAFAMQCMSTIAIVKREAGGWKMALFQLGMMTGLAYLASLVVYQILK